MEVVPTNRAESDAFIRLHHRHHKPTVGSVFRIALAHDGEVIGVAVIGRPVARMASDGWTLELTRLCVKPGSPKGACSKLYSTAWRIAQMMGYKQLITYTLPEEGGQA